MEEQGLTGKQKRHLRALGSELEPVVQIGKNSITDTVIQGAADALAARELIKVQVLQNCPDEPKDVVAELAAALGAAMVQVIGRKGLLYKENPEKPKIELPRW